VDQVDRFNKRKHILGNERSKQGLALVADLDIVDTFLSSPVDHRSVESVASNLNLSVDWNVEVSDQEIHEHLESIVAAYDSEKFNELFASCKESVLSSISGPFGLGKKLSKWDRVGGAVTTGYNANKGIFSDDSEAYNQKDYRTHEYKENAKFIKESNTVNLDVLSDDSWSPDHLIATGAEDYIVDRYSGKENHPNVTDIDHVVAAEDYHKNGGFMQSKSQKRAFGADQNNLAPTGRSGNRSMGSNKKDVWQAKDATDGSGKTNKEVHGHDNRRVNPAVARGNDTAKKHLPTDSERVEYYAKKISTSGAAEGAKMGVQQALGLLLSEFFEATFDEIMDIYKNGFASGFDDGTFFNVLKERLVRISKRLLARWKDACKAFSSGFLSGFLSNIVTVVINTFYSTSKRMVRIVREGFFSLLKAVKMLCLPPEGMTLAQSAHEASKIIASGLIIAIGVIVEQKIGEFISAIPFSDIVTAALIGSLTGLATTFTVYLIDKMDLFGTIAQEKHKFSMKVLDTHLDNLFIQTEELISEMNFNCLQVAVIKEA
jgi:hypothetical protein